MGTRAVNGWIGLDRASIKIHPYNLKWMDLDYDIIVQKKGGHMIGDSTVPGLQLMKSHQKIVFLTHIT